MPLPPEKRLKFFVYIIESPSAVDFYHNRHEGELLRQSLQLNQIPCISRLAVKREAFEAALKIGLPEAMNIFTNLIPIVHLSAHGNSNGLSFSDDSTITWYDLKAILQPINNALKNNLLLCMSCCKGYSGVQMAMNFGNEDNPFFALVGNYESPTWAETSVAFSTFYHLLNKGELILDAVKSMNIASGCTSFKAERAEDSRRDFIDYCSQFNLQQAQTELRTESEIYPKDSLAKFSNDKSKS